MDSKAHMSNRNYEAMFILDNNAATADFEGTSGQVDAILEKHGASIAQKEKWDERKLAYEIKGQRRGTYYLTYFNADPDSIRKINEDVQLSETILRHLVIALEGSVEDHIETMDKEREMLAEDSRKNSLGGWGGRRGERRGPPSKPAGAPAKSAADAPAADAPAADAPAADAKPADAPAAEAAKADAPAAEAAKADAPAAEAPADKKTATDKSETTATEASAES